MDYEGWDFANSFCRKNITKEDVKIYPNIVRDVLSLIKLKLEYTLYAGNKVYKEEEMTELLKKYKQELTTSYLTIHEFWEKYVPCWETVRYNLSPSGIANKLKPFLLRHTDLWVEKGGGKYVYPLKILKSAYTEYKETYVSYKSFRKEFQGITSGAPKNKPLQYFLDTWPEIRGNFFYYAKKRTGYLEELTKSDFKAQELLKDYICCLHPSISAIVSGNISDAINESFRLKWFELDFSQPDKETNIIWSTSNYVSLSSLYSMLISSNETSENIIQEIKNFEHLICYRPVLENGEGYLEFDLYFSYQTLKEICSRFKVPSLPNPEKDCGSCEYCSKSTIGIEPLGKDSLLKTEIIKLFENKQRTFGMRDILNELKKLQCPHCNSDKIYPIIKNLREKGCIKIVDFESSCKMLPIYQNIKGPLPSAEFIEENSEQYRKMKLISIRDFCKGDYREYQTLLTLADTKGIPKFIARKRNGFSRVYRTQDLLVLRVSLKGLVSQCNEPKVKKISKLESMKADIDHDFKTINIFGFEITWRKKKAVTNTDTDLIEF